VSPLADILVMHRAKRFLVRELCTSREIHVDVHLKLLLLDPQDVLGFHQPQQVFKELWQLIFHHAPSLVFFLKDCRTQFPFFTKLAGLNPH